jgi:phage terminase large subunit GpA-like protein
MFVSADSEQKRLEDARNGLYSDVAAVAGDVLAEREPLSILEWGERYYQLPETSFVKGLFSIEDAPYLRDVFASLENPLVRRTIFGKGSQLFVTTVGTIWTGWSMDMSPAAMQIVWPVEPAAKKYVLRRINPMIETAEPLKRLFSRNGRRESDDSMKHKRGPGFTIDFVSAKSIHELKSNSAERQHVSEVDELEPNLKDQGDALELSRRALRTFPNSKEFLECTPVKWGQSRVWDELGMSSWKEFFVPCPHCGFMQVLRWRDGEDGEDTDSKGTKRFVYDVDASGFVVKGSTHYVCADCACLISHASKRWMLNHGEWRARYPERIEIDGYHLSALYTMVPKYDWDYCAQLGEQSTRNPLTRKIFVNTILGLPLKDTSEDADEHFLQARATAYPAAVPDGVLVLTVSVDVQGDRLEVLVVGWGAGEEAWVIEWHRIEQDPSLQSTWERLAEYLDQEWLDARGKGMAPRAIAIDAGYQSEKVKKFCARFRTRAGVRPIHVIGRDGRTRPVIEQPGADVSKRRRSKRPSWIVGSDTVKDYLSAKLKTLSPGPDYINFPLSLDAAFYKQLTAETLQTVYTGGRPSQKWILPPDRRNEALDLMVYAYAALHSIGGKLIRDLARLGMGARKRPAPVKPDATLVEVLQAEPKPMATPETPKPKALPKPRTRMLSSGVY